LDEESKTDASVTIDTLIFSLIDEMAKNRQQQDPNARNSHDQINTFDSQSVISY